MRAIRPPVEPCSRSSATTTSTFAQAGALDELGQHARGEDRRIDPSDGGAVGLEQLEEALVAEGGHLDRLPERGPHLALGERPQDLDIDDHGRRLMERTQEVLALREVDAGLATDRRVDLGDERRRDLDDPDAAQVDRGKEAGRIAERPAADRDQRLGAFDPERGELPRGDLDHVEPFGPFALGKEDLDDLAAALTQVVRQSLPDGVPGTGFAHEDRARGADEAQRGVECLGGDAVAERDPPDRGLGPQEGGAGRRVAAGQRLLDRVDHAADLPDPELMDACGGVEPLALRGEIADGPDRIPAGDERPDVRGAAEALG